MSLWPIERAWFSRGIYISKFVSFGIVWRTVWQSRKRWHKSGANSHYKLPLFLAIRLKSINKYRAFGLPKIDFTLEENVFAQHRSSKYINSLSVYYSIDKEFWTSLMICPKKKKITLEIIYICHICMYSIYMCMY